MHVGKTLERRRETPRTATMEQATTTLDRGFPGPPEFASLPKACRTCSYPGSEALPRCSQSRRCLLKPLGDCGRRLRVFSNLDHPPPRVSLNKTWKMIYRGPDTVMKFMSFCEILGLPKLFCYVRSLVFKFLCAAKL